MIANTPKPPYFAVIFTSTRNSGDNGYDEMADKMLDLASRQDIGITVSYWRDLSSIKKWKENTEHSIARKKGKTDWYQSFKVRVAKVERDYQFEKLKKYLLYICMYKQINYIFAPGNDKM